MASIPVVIPNLRRRGQSTCYADDLVAGDELQMPPVPFESSLLAPVEGSSHEQKVGVKIFSGIRHVYRLTTAMRFKDDLLSGMLTKMRTKYC